jgi:hypothetical protein
MLVVAKSKGYFGGVIREAGDKFDVPDDIWDDKKRRPSWASEAGGAPAKVVEASAPSTAAIIPADWRSLSAADRKALAAALSGQKVSTAGEADKIILALIEAAKPAPFSDAPAPETIIGNGVQQALGGNQPDWVDPSHQASPAQVD